MTTELVNTPEFHGPWRHKSGNKEMPSMGFLPWFFTLLPFITSLSTAQGLLIVSSRYHNTPYPWPTTTLPIFSSNARRELHLLTNITQSPWIQTSNLSLLDQWCFVTWTISPSLLGCTQLFSSTVLSALLKTIVLKQCLIVKQVMSVHTQ